MVDANGCSTQYTISTTFDSDGVPTVTGVNPCCTLSLCYSIIQFYEQGGFKLILMPSGGSGTYYFTYTANWSNTGSGGSISTTTSSLQATTVGTSNLTLVVYVNDANGCVIGPVTITVTGSTNNYTVTGVSTICPQ